MEQLRNKGKKFICTCGLWIPLCLSSCTVMNEEYTSPNKDSFVEGESEMPGKTVVLDEHKFETQAIKFIEDEIIISDPSGKPNYRLQITNIELLSTLIGEASCWQTEIGMKNVVGTEAELKEGKILYIDCSVENLLEQECDFYATTVAPMGVDNGNVYPISEIPNYYSLMGDGKDAYLLRMLPREQKEIKIGYYISDEMLDLYDIYIDPTAGTSYDEDKIFYSILGVSSIQKE